MKKIELLYKHINVAYSVLQRLAKQPLRGSTAYVVAKNISVFKAIVEPTSEMLRAKFIELCEKDNAGNPILYAVEAEKAQRLGWGAVKDDTEIWNEQFAELYKEQNKIAVYNIVDVQNRQTMDEFSQSTENDTHTIEIRTVGLNTLHEMVIEPEALSYIEFMFNE